MRRKYFQIELRHTDVQNFGVGKVFYVCKRSLLCSTRFHYKRRVLNIWLKCIITTVYSHMSLQKSSLKKHLILLMLKTVVLLNVFNWIQYMSDTFSIFILLNKNFKRTKIFCDIINVFTVTFDQCIASLLKTLLTSNFGTVVCCVLWDYNMYCRSKVMGCCDNAWQTGWKGKDSYEWQTQSVNRDYRTVSDRQQSSSSQTLSSSPHTNY